MKVLKIIAFAGVVLSAVPAISAEWISVEGTMQEFLFDKSRVSRVGKSRNIQTWVQTVLPQENVNAMASRNAKYQNYDHSLTLWEMNCDDRTLAYRGGTSYSSAGESIKEWSSPKPLVPVRPDTNEELVVNAICQVAVKKKGK